MEKEIQLKAHPIANMCENLLNLKKNEKIRTPTGDVKKHQFPEFHHLAHLRFDDHILGRTFLACSPIRRSR